MIFRSGMAAAALTAALGMTLASGAERLFVDTATLKWDATKHCRWLTSDGRRLMRVVVPADDPDPAARNCVFADIDLKPFRGRAIDVSVRLRGIEANATPGKWGGPVLLLYFKTAGGKEEWVSVEMPQGTFDWREAAIAETIPPDADRGILRLGIQEGTGQADFDMESLRIAAVPDYPRNPEAQADPALAAECGMIADRMRAAFLALRRPITPEAAAPVLAALQPDGRYGDLDYADRNRSKWEPGRHLGRTFDLAVAWSTPGHPLHRREDVGRAVRRAVAWWCVHRPQSDNWWWNDMFVPEALAQILIVAPELFPGGPERDAALSVCGQARFLRRYTGNNRVYVAANIFMRGLLERNEPAMTAAADALGAEFRPAPDAAFDRHRTEHAGPQADGSFHQHGPQPQFGNYGEQFLTNARRWAGFWAGTRWAFDDAQWGVVRQLADGLPWVLWRGKMDLLAIGRQLFRNAGAEKGRVALANLSGLAAADPEGRARYEAALRANDGGPAAPVGNRHFWNSDYMVHRRPEWLAAVRMNSVRVRPLEDDINWDNALGRYLSDGACLVYRSGDEYTDITACWDWTRLPGTTLPKTPVYTEAESRAINLRSGPNPPRWTLARAWRRLGEGVFTGGVTDGTCGVAVHTMELDGVTARKAYFFDRDAIHQLGAGISSTSPFPVATTVNQCRRVGDVAQGAGWFWHDGIGYRGEGMADHSGLRDGDWRYVEGFTVTPTPARLEIFSLQIDHGLKPSGADYAFSVLPGRTAAETAAVPATPVASNTAGIQAVTLADGRLAAVFHEAGRLGAFETFQPGLFIIGEDRVYLADPTARLREMKVAYRGVTRTVALPTGELAGRSVICEW